MNKRMPRPAQSSQAASAQPVAQPVGYGQRSIWPYPPVGEAVQRDPHIPDPVPGATSPTNDQCYASPPVPKVGKLHAGGSVSYEGTAIGLVYIKRIGSVVQRTLARALLYANQEARWRVGGVGYPPDFGFGPGYHGDAATLVPDNPQIYLRNPGIKPIVNMPQTYRYAPNMVQNVGPAIGDVH